MSDDAALRQLMEAIAAADDMAARDLLAASPLLATAALTAGATRAAAVENFLPDIAHHIYAGDTALHVAAAAHRPAMVRALIERGADVGARNRRGATPLHYAADGSPGAVRWNPADQAATIALLIASGADPNATDKNDVTALHRAVRTRCAGAVAALLGGGADPRRTNGNGSTPAMLATRQTGKSGSGTPEAKAQQAEILRLFEHHGV
ncbi:MAG: ankyrin repeat protein [Sphingomonas bacterium]|uniref:ankyrin repeat domain-containing protein n=1 Tax=Sphingomonas bacterium TaxID=1895847 RepID=UPI002631BB63|nr:ankyrin repeat domain-containing protein [Sphingomonas bacterium]MDB5708635.1 ankyrin repeat protein [Sphingomonas bacterium]